jgi:integrase/recombinase XerD
MNSYPLTPLTKITHPDDRQVPDRPTDLRSRYIHDFLASRHLAANTQKAYTKELNRFLAWSNLPLTEVSTKQIIQFKQHLEMERHLKPASINRALAAIASFYNWLLQGYPTQFSQNPTQAIDFASIPTPIAQDLSESEVVRLWHVVTNSHTSDAVQLRNAALLSILSHGLRASEVAGLTVGDFDGKRLYIRVAKDNSTGTVPLNAQAREHIANYLNWRETQSQKLLDSSPLLLSCSNRNQGQALSYEGIYKIVANWGIKAEIPHLHPHRLRHTYATKLLLLGMDSYLARSLTRHQSETSFNRYAKRARAIAAEKAFYQAIGEENN